MGEFCKDDRLELVYEAGRPSYFREKPWEGDACGINKTTASYLQEARPLGTSEYLNRTLTHPVTVPPAMPSPSDLPIFTPSEGAGGSTASTPEILCLTGFALSGLGIVMEDKSSSDSFPEQISKTASVPYGKRLIPQIMDSLAAAETGRIVFSLATISGDSLEFRHVSARAFTKAVDKTAWWLQNQIGKPDSVQALGYTGPRKLGKEHLPC
jgi:hypothetical protein